MLVDVADREQALQLLRGEPREKVMAAQAGEQGGVVLHHPNVPQDGTISCRLAVPGKGGRRGRGLVALGRAARVRAGVASGRAGRDTR